MFTFWTLWVKYSTIIYRMHIINHLRFYLVRNYLVFPGVIVILHAVFQPEGHYRFKFWFQVYK